MTDKPANFADSIGRAAQCGSDEESGMQLRHHASLKTAAKDLRCSGQFNNSLEID